MYVYERGVGWVPERPFDPDEILKLWAAFRPLPLQWMELPPEPYNPNTGLGRLMEEAFHETLERYVRMGVFAPAMFRDIVGV
jgi:hypothetical protein